MAVMAKPRKAGKNENPASYPRNGGNIRLPAPKNMENTVSESTMRFFTDSMMPLYHFLWIMF